MLFNTPYIETRLPMAETCVSPVCEHLRPADTRTLPKYVGCEREGRYQLFRFSGSLFRVPAVLRKLPATALQSFFRSNTTGQSTAVGLLAEKKIKKFFRKAKLSRAGTDNMYRSRGQRLRNPKLLWQMCTENCLARMAAIRSLSASEAPEETRFAHR